MQSFREIARCFIHNTETAGMSEALLLQCPGESRRSPPAVHCPQERGRTQGAALGTGFTKGEESQGQSMPVLTLLLLPSPWHLCCCQRQLCSSEAASSPLGLPLTQSQDKFKSNTAVKAMSLAPLLTCAFVYSFLSPH